MIFGLFRALPIIYPFCQVLFFDYVVFMLRYNGGAGSPFLLTCTVPLNRTWNPIGCTFCRPVRIPKPSTCYFKKALACLGVFGVTNLVCDTASLCTHTYTHTATRLLRVKSSRPPGTSMCSSSPPAFFHACCTSAHNSRRLEKTQQKSAHRGRAERGEQPRQNGQDPTPAGGRISCQGREEKGQESEEGGKKGAPFVPCACTYMSVVHSHYV